MSELRDESYLTALKETQSELSQIKTSGDWLVTAGFSAAAFIFIGAALIAIAALGADQVLALNPTWYAAAFFVLSGPAMAAILAGYLGRQSMRSARANMLILRASQMLLMPADTASQRIDTIAGKVRDETGKVDELIETAHASLATMRETLGSEREQIASFVDQNTTSISDMMKKLAEERMALAELSSAVEAQTAAISEAIPRQARVMAEAARLAQQEVAKADMAVDERLISLDESGRKLGEKLAKLNDMSEEAEARSARISQSIVDMEQKLRQSAQTVHSALQASEIASTAATETGDALNAAVANALDGTREASEFIRRQSRDAVEEAQKSIAELKAAGEQAEVATRAAALAAREQANETEQRITELNQLLYEAATRATSTAEAGLERARQRIERASALLNNGWGDEDYSAPPRPQPAPRPAPAPQPEPPNVQLRPRQDQPAAPTAPEPFSPPPAPAPQRPVARTPQADDGVDPLFDPVEPPAQRYNLNGAASEAATETSVDVQEREAPDAAENSLFDIAFDNASQKEMGISWKDLLAGLNPEEPAERDQAARNILKEIEETGNIELDEAFSMRETRKIAGASRKGERQRRRAVREYAGSTVQGLRYRLEDEPQFNISVERFLTNESSDATRLLTEADRSRTAASSRLAAFLLLDTAYSALHER